MNLAIEKLPECRAKLTAEVPAATVAETRKAVVFAFMSQAKIPGFRPGKLPQKLVEKKFGPRIEEELKERLTRSVLQEAVQNQNLALLGIAEVEREVFEADGTFSFNAEVVVKPEFDLTEEEYKNLEIEVVKQEVTDEMINEWLGKVQANFPTFHDSEEAIEPGDRAMITFSATRDGKPLTEELKEELAPLAIREEPFELMIPLEDQSGYEMIPGLADGIVGLRTGESKDVEVKFEENYFIEDLRGTSATYSVNVTEVKKAELPPIDDELAKKIGGEDLASVKKQYKTEMEAQFENGRRQQIENQILERLNKEHEFDLPKEQVFDETQYQVNQMVSHAYKQGMKPNDLDEHEKEIVDSAAARAVSNLRTRYILDVIARKEKITVSEEELSQQVAYMAHREKKNIKKFARELRDGPGFEGIRDNIRISKTIAFLRDNASVKEVEVPKEEEESTEESA